MAGGRHLQRLPLRSEEGCEGAHEDEKVSTGAARAVLIPPFAFAVWHVENRNPCRDPAIFCVSLIRFSMKINHTIISDRLKSRRAVSPSSDLIGEGVLVASTFRGMSTSTVRVLSWTSRYRGIGINAFPLIKSERRASIYFIDIVSLARCLHDQGH